MATAAEKAPKIHKALIDVGKKIKAVGKDAQNKEQKFAYRSIYALMNALQPIMAEVGVHSHLVKYGEIRETEFKTRNGATGRRIVLDATYRLTAEDGSYVETTVPGEAFDYGDKGIGKALVYANKTFLTQTFNVPTEDMQDPDENAHEFSEQTGSDKKPEKKAPAPTDEEKRACKNIKEAYQGAADTGMLDEAVKEFKKDAAALPDEMQEYLKNIRHAKIAEILVEAYKNCENGTDLAVINKHAEKEKGMLEETANKIKEARTEAEARLDDIPF